MTGRERRALISCIPRAIGRVHKGSTPLLQQVDHGLLASTDETRAWPVEIDDYGKNQGDGQCQHAHGKDIPASVHAERISYQHC